MTSDRLREAVETFAQFRAAQREPAPDLFSQISTAVQNAGEIWRAEELRAVEEIAHRHTEFTVEDVSPLVGPTYDGRALGGILLEAERRGICHKLGWVGSGRERHGRPVGLWASRIYRGPIHAT